MATYAELLVASENPTLNNKIRVACFIAAEVVRTEGGATANHANRLVWAKSVFANPDQEAKRMLWAVLAQNASATLAQITGATDAAVQTAVNAAVDVFATGT
jgi:hypothetical protein